MNNKNYNSYLVLGVVVVVVVFLFIFGLLNNKEEEPLADNGFKDGEMILTTENAEDEGSKDEQGEDAEPTLSTEFSDEEILKQLVLGFNDEWIEFVNAGSTEIFNYVRKDTDIINDILVFDTDGLTEELMDIEVTDIRVDGDTAYIYDYEKFRKVRDGVETFQDYEWIYTAKKVDDKWLLETFEPAN